MDQVIRMIQWASNSIERWGISIPFHPSAPSPVGTHREVCTWRALDLALVNVWNPLRISSRAMLDFQLCWGWGFGLPICNLGRARAASITDQQLVLNDLFVQFGMVCNLLKVLSNLFHTGLPMSAALKEIKA